MTGDLFILYKKVCKFPRNQMETLDNYLHWYNNKRIKMPLGGMSPVQYRKSLRFAL